MRASIAVALAVLPLAACGNGSDPGAQPSDEESAAPTAAPPSQAPAPDATIEPNAIPATLRGRWGLTAADCAPGRADATGLLTITADKLEFYESVGTLDGVEEASESRVRAAFDFTGEGMTWERDIALEMQDGGQTLIRREYGEGAAPDPIRYTKCA